MIDKSYWDDILDKAKSISENYSLLQLSEKVNITKKELHDFDIKVLFVGHFSAGKSALLNGLLERPDFLTEDQLPQTAVAAELHWSEQEFMKLFLEDGTAQTCNVQTKAFPKNISSRLSPVTVSEAPSGTRIPLLSRRLSPFITRVQRLPAPMSMQGL